jgi:hypothetical protein
LTFEIAGRACEHVTSGLAAAASHDVTADPAVHGIDSRHNIHISMQL